jgi:hypothetical protein
MTAQIDAEIAAIKARNARVEADKAWEGSKSRICAVALVTYLMMVLLMSVLRVDGPFVSALVPTAGFLLSTVSLKAVKRLWITKIYKA